MTNLRFNADGSPNTNIGHTEIHPQPGHKSYIKLCDNFYECRVINNIREVLYMGKWITHSDFVDRLFKDDKMDEIVELLQAARAKKA